MRTELVMYILLGTPLAFIIVDIYLALDGRKGNTYSEIIREASKKWMPIIMILCYGFGLLSGHWWW